MIDVKEILEQGSQRFLQEPGARQRLERRRDRKRRNQRIGAGIVGVSVAVVTIGALVLESPFGRPPTPEAPSGLNGRIAFARAVSHDAEPEFTTYTANPDGTDVQRLPAGDSFQPHPQWSPNGREIAITEPKTPTPGCADMICTAVIVNVDTGGYRGIPWRMPGVWDVDCFPWSPDGELLACGAVDDNGTDLSGIYTIRASDGSDPTRITPCGECVPGDFSPDGTRIVFASTDEGGNVGLFVVRLDGGGRHRITPPSLLGNGVNGGSWSPTGDRIVFQARSGPGQYPSLWVVNADGTGLQQLPIPACGGPVTDKRTAPCRLPTWSPDGLKIAFSRRAPAQASASGLYFVNADGSGLTRITNDGRGDNQPDWGTHPVTTGG